MNANRQDVQHLDAGTADRQFELQFRFEWGTVELATGELFSPEHEALHRWEEFTPACFDWVGATFALLYELRDGRFIQLQYEMCHQHETAEGTLWSGGSPPAGGVVTAVAAAQFILRLQQALPAQLHEAYEDHLQSRTEEAPRPPRPLSHWVQRTPPGRVSHQRLTSDRLIDRIDDLTRTLYLFVEDYRGRLELQPDHHNYEPRNLARELWAWDLFNTDGWDWSSGQHPPSHIEWLKAPWPTPWKPIRSLMWKVRLQLASTIPCLMHRWLSDFPESPTELELQKADDVIRKRLPDLERLSAELQGAWRSVPHLDLSGAVAPETKEEVDAPGAVLPFPAAEATPPSLATAGDLPELEFHPGGFRLGDQVVAMSGRSLALFSRFAHAYDGKLTEQVANASLWGPDSIEPASVGKTVSRLRRELRLRLQLPEGVNPLPLIDRGRELAWRLDLQFKLVSQSAGPSTPSGSLPLSASWATPGPQARRCA